MLAIALRLLIGLLGLMSLAQAGHLWLDPHAAGATLGVADQGLTGLATLRADIGGLFGGMGLMMLYGAVRQSPIALTATLVMVSTALAGRLVAAAHDGLGQAQMPPLVVEVVMVALLTLGRQVIRKV